MRIQTRGNTNVVWLSSETGVINGTMTLSATPLEKILQAVNEKYGTSFESWSQLPTEYEVGDTVPNWNSYEKIDLHYAVRDQNSTGNYYFGYIENQKFVLACKENGQNSYLCNSNGVITFNSAAPFQYINKQGIIDKFANESIIITDIDYYVLNANVGDNVAEWYSYKIVE